MEKLLSEKKIIYSDISVNDLKYLPKAAIINSMLDLGDNLIEIKNIVVG